MPGHPSRGAPEARPWRQPVNGEEGASWEEEKREILLGIINLAESFLPAHDDAETAERRMRIAEARREAEQLTAIPDFTLVRNLWGGVLLEADMFRQLAAVGRDSLDLAEEFAAELDHITGARSRANAARAAVLRQRLIDLRTAGEKISYIATTLGRTERWVYLNLPENMKPRR